MRYYKITATLPNKSKPEFEYEALSGGRGLNISFEVLSAGSDIVLQQATIALTGVSIQDVYAAPKLKDATIKIIAGFKPSFAITKKYTGGVGTIVNGKVLNAWGDWIGNERTLHIVVNAGGSEAFLKYATERVCTGKKGTLLSAAFAKALRDCHPEADVRVLIANDYVLKKDLAITYKGVDSLKQQIQNYTTGVFGAKKHWELYWMGGAAYSLIDASNLKQKTGSVVKQIEGVEIIGLPTFIGYSTISIPCILRPDIRISDWVKLNVAFNRKSGNEFLSYNPTLQKQTAYDFNLQSEYQVTAIKHTAVYRDPSPMAWSTIIEGVLDRYYAEPVLSLSPRNQEADVN